MDLISTVCAVLIALLSCCSLRPDPFPTSPRMHTHTHKHTNTKYRYYSYKYAEVMSADAFGAFEEAGLDDEEAVSRVGMRFKDTVLSMGGGRHPAKVFRDFRGRDPTPEALLKHSGLATAAA